MGRLAGISGKRAISAFLRAGFEAKGGDGSHVVLKKPGFPILVIPLHRSLSPFLLRSQIRRAGMSEEEFLELLR
ncbi:MAG: type II toxin-antitoxin system HicA family toxin [Planctomycetes bacterium]|nr:type II toxin-antitoxin system HicA family toxin [Planctomycetota bacterium]